MKKITIIITVLILFWLAHQVRSSYLAGGDYNEPSDASEYRLAIRGTSGVFIILKDFLTGKSKLHTTREIRHSLTALNTHEAPLYLTYLWLLTTSNISLQTVALFANTLLVPILFLTAMIFLPYWVSLLVGLVAAVYTPLFAFIFSLMSESFTAVIVPLCVTAGALLVTKTKNIATFFSAGLLLFLLGVSRPVFQFYGLVFLGICYLMIKTKDKRLTIALGVGYLLPTLVWQVFIRINTISEYINPAVANLLEIPHRLITDGWAMDGPSRNSWPNAIEKTFLKQNLFELGFLELERINRFLRNPANSYTGSFPLSQEVLVWLHRLILFFAAWGIKTIFKNRFFLLITSFVIWNTLFISALYLEEIRYQIPMLGLLLLLTGAGIGEYMSLWRQKQIRKWLLFLPLLLIAWFFGRDYLLGLEFWLMPLMGEVSYWRVINFAIVLALLGFFLKRVSHLDKTWRKECTLFFLVICGIVFAPELRSRIWHQWTNALRAQETIEQQILISSTILEKLKDKQGYLIIDFKDPNAAVALEISLNGKVLPQRLAMMNKTSPVDLMAVRQWQRTMSRLGGYKQLDAISANAPAWPNLHDWLVIPITGEQLATENLITVKNVNQLSSSLPIIYGDFLPFGAQNYYEGPTPRIFQGWRTHNKYQIDGDMRLTEKRKLYSVKNSSTLILSNGFKVIDDLSLNVGRQIGRYRIFFLFPFKTGDPEDIF